MTTENLEKKIQEAVGREIENHPELNRTLLETIHDPAINDAQKVARIAQNMFALGGHFFTLVYDHLILEQMVESPFLDIEGVERAITIVESDKDFEVVDGVLHISEKKWASMSLMNDDVKMMLGRYFLGLQVNGKLSQKHSKAIQLRITTEFTAFSDRLNREFYEYEEDYLRALALTISELSLKFILPLAPNFCTEEQYAKMFDFAYNAIVKSMDDPSEKPFMRAFNESAPNALFLDDRSANLLRIFRSHLHMVKDAEELRETFPLDYMSQCMALVRF